MDDFTEPPGPPDSPDPAAAADAGRASVATTADALAMASTLDDCGEAPPGSLLLVLADALGLVELVVGVDEVPADPPQHERVGLLAPFLREVAARLDGVAGVLLVVCRDGAAEVDGGDLAWHDAVSGAAGVAGLTDYGTVVVTPRGVVPVRPGLPRQVA